MPADKLTEDAAPDLKARVLAILDENRLMTLATLRKDGWPQATTVGYLREDLTLYCAVGRSSQKFENISHDGRVSVAIARDGSKDLRGVSMAAKASAVADAEEVEHVDRLLHTRYAGQTIFSPREPNVAIIRISPQLISLVDPQAGSGRPRLLAVRRETSLLDVGSPPSGGL